MTDLEWLKDIIKGFTEEERQCFEETLHVTKDVPVQELAKHLAAEGIIANRRYDDVLNILHFYFNIDDPETFDSLMHSMMEGYVDDIDEFLQTEPSWFFGILRSPGDWRLLPYITTNRRGWTFRWIMFEISSTN